MGVIGNCEVLERARFSVISKSKLYNTSFCHNKVHCLREYTPLAEYSTSMEELLSVLNCVFFCVLQCIIQAEFIISKGQKTSVIDTNSVKYRI